MSYFIYDYIMVLFIFDPFISIYNKYFKVFLKFEYSEFDHIKRSMKK